MYNLNFCRIVFLPDHVSSDIYGMRKKVLEVQNVPIEIKFIAREVVEEMIQQDSTLPLEIVEKAFKRRMDGSVLSPDKISQIFNQETQERINCLVATLLDEQVCGVKWVSVFPPNSEKQLLNVTGVIVLSSLLIGYPLAIIDGTYVTAVRTAAVGAVGAVGAKYLSRPDSKIVGFIGSGEQARMHFRMIKQIRPIMKCFVASRRRSSEQSFIQELRGQYPDVEFIACSGDYDEAARNADIIVTAVSCQAPLLKARHIKPGTTYIHVGGWEDEYAVAQNADKIVCDEWEAVKHRSQTLSRMYYEGLLADEDIYADIAEIVTGKKRGRENDTEFIYFNSVGMANISVMCSYDAFTYAQVRSLGQQLFIQGG